MAIENTWTIANLEHRTDDGGVVVAHWRVTAQDGDHSVSAYGTASFSPDPDADGYVPFDQLTEADVLEWVYTAVDKAETEANLAAKIDKLKNPETVDGLPWAAEE